MEKIGILVKQVKNASEKDTKSLLYIKEQLEHCKTIITKNPRRHRLAKQIDNSISNIDQELRERNKKNKIEIKKCSENFSELDSLAGIRFKIDLIKNNYKKLNDHLIFLKSNDLQAKAYLELIQNNEKQTSQYLQKLNTNLSNLYLETSKNNIKFMDTCLEFIRDNENKIKETSELLKMDTQEIKTYLKNISKTFEKEHNIHKIKADLEEIENCFNLEEPIITPDDDIFNQISNLAS